MTEPTHSTHSDYCPGWGGAASHAWAIAAFGPTSTVLYRGTQPREATDLAGSAFELEAFRSKAKSPAPPRHPTYPQLGIQVSLSQWLTFVSPALSDHA